MSNKDLLHAEKSLLRKGPSFIPIPTDINWYNLRRDFDSFFNKLRYRVSKPAETSSINVNHTTNISNSLVRQLGNPPIEAKSSNVNFRKEKTNISSLEAFIDLVEKDLFKPVNVTYRRNKNLKELISPSLFLRTIKELLSTEFTCHATKRKYKIGGFLICNTKNIIYLIVCKCCSKQYIGSSTGFKERFRISKSDFNTSKIRCGVASHLVYVCKSATCKTEYLQVQLIEHVLVREGEDADKVLW